jgi:hypothetical protein
MKKDVVSSISRTPHWENGFFSRDQCELKFAKYIAIRTAAKVANGIYVSTG